MKLWIFNSFNIYFIFNIIFIILIFSHVMFEGVKKIEAILSDYVVFSRHEKFLKCCKIYFVIYLMSLKRCSMNLFIVWKSILLSMLLKIRKIILSLINFFVTNKCSCFQTNIATFNIFISHLGNLIRNSNCISVIFYPFLSE